MTPDTVTLEQAEKLMSLPRTVGQIDGEPVTAQNGRYGPYIKRGATSRPLPDEDAIFTVSLDEAKALLDAAPVRGARASAALREFGADPTNGKTVTLKNGRFGPYVTDGEFNATLRRDDSVEEITAERAFELLAEKRAKGPAPKRTTRRTTKTSKTGGSTKAAASRATSPAKKTT